MRFALGLVRCANACDVRRKFLVPAEMRHETAYPSDPHHRILLRLVALLLHRRLNVALVDGKGVRWMVALASLGEFQEQPRRTPALGRLPGRFEIALPEQDAHQRRGVFGYAPPPRRLSAVGRRGVLSQDLELPARHRTAVQ